MPAVIFATFNVTGISHDELTNNWSLQICHVNNYAIQINQCVMVLIYVYLIIQIECE